MIPIAIALLTALAIALVLYLDRLDRAIEARREAERDLQPEDRQG